MNPTVSVNKTFRLENSTARVVVDKVVNKASSTGTISSVSKLRYKDKELIFDETNAGELGTKLYNEITGIHYGRIDDKYGWITPIE